MNVVRRLFRGFTLLVLYSLAAQMTSMNGNATSVEARGRHGDLTTRESVKAWLSNIPSAGVFFFVGARRQIIAHAATAGIQEGAIDIEPGNIRRLSSLLSTAACERVSYDPASFQKQRPHHRRVTRRIVALGLCCCDGAARGTTAAQW